MKIMCVGGIRPDWINLSVIFEQLEKNKVEHLIVHTGQHYSYYLDRIFFEQLGIRQPDFFLDVGSGTQGEQTARTIERSEKIMLEEKPDLLISFSDANPALSAIAATKQHIKVAHLEAGMRSNDWRMPEEKNRRLVDCISDYLFPPTRIAYDNLVSEGVGPSKIFEVSKIIIDVLDKFERQIDGSDIIDETELVKSQYFLCTAHRPENVNDPNILGNLLMSLDMVEKAYDMKIVAPLHPRTRDNIKKFGLEIKNENIHLMEPLGFFEFSKLEKNAFCVITDSGTVQEDACYFHVPCVTTRISTERMETLEVGSNALADRLDAGQILDYVKKMTEIPRDWKIPYRKGSAERIVKVLKGLEQEILSQKVWW